MRRIFALITAVMVLCAGCGGDPGISQSDFREVSAVLEEGCGWDGENLELQRRLVRWYHFNLRSDHPDPEYRDGYNSILAGSGGIMGWVEFPHIPGALPLLHGNSTGEGFQHQKDTPFPTGEGGTSVLRLSGDTQARLIRRLALEEGMEFRIHILDYVITYRIYAVEAGDRLPGQQWADDRCVLVFPQNGGDLLVLGIREES